MPPVPNRASSYLHFRCRLLEVAAQLGIVLASHVTLQKAGFTGLAEGEGELRSRCEPGQGIRGKFESTMSRRNASACSAVI